MVRDLSNKGLVFDEESHTYTYNGRILKSVTTLLSEYFPKFDGKGIAKKISAGFKHRNYQKVLRGVEVTDLEKKKATQKYWLEEWKQSALIGTAIHAEIENFIRDGQPTNSIKSSQAVKYLKSKHIPSESKLIPEQRVMTEKYGLAGTVDLLCRCDDGRVIMSDWKSNKAISTTPKEAGETGTHPVTAHLSNCHVNKYGLQLMVYSYLLKEEYGIKVDVLHIVHLLDNEYVIYEITNDEDLVKDILNSQS